jgi:hypothetical protein
MYTIVTLTEPDILALQLQPSLADEPVHLSDGTRVVSFRTPAGQLYEQATRPSGHIEWLRWEDEP